VSAPGPSASAIQVDAHKKWLLFQLLINGKVQPLPRYTSSAVTQACKNLNSAYIDYADKYINHNKDALRAATQKHRDTFEKVSEPKPRSSEPVLTACTDSIDRTTTLAWSSCVTRRSGGGVSKS